MRYPLVSQMTPLGALKTAPGCARAHVKNTLKKWELSAYEEVAELLISEMATNAVEASTDEKGHPIYVNGRMPLIVVRLVATGEGVVLEVWDFMPTIPEMKTPATLEERGRGLFLVDTLSYQWAWKTAPDWPGKCVWAELRLRA
jgi:anti-sigma regulatory factor (Ser/Thr protein kinase)